MNPIQAQTALLYMGVTEPAGMGGFRIVRPPRRPKDFATFIHAIKTLGAWSTAREGSQYHVRVECAVKSDELIFFVGT